MISLIALFILLLLASAFFSSSETMLFSLSRLQLLRLKSRKSKDSHKIFSLLRKPREILTTILLGNELMNVCISIVGATIINRFFNATVRTETILAVAIVTPIVLIFGEILPKTVALNYAWKLAHPFIKPLAVFNRIIAPIRKMLVFLADGIVRAAGGVPKASQPMIMEDEYKKLIDQGTKHGVLVKEERELIHNVFEFTNKKVKDIMIPRGNIIAQSLAMNYETLLTRLSATDYTRIPMYDKDFDNMIGILHRRDLFVYNRSKKRGASQKISDILRAPFFASPKEDIDELMHRFQATRIHMALVKERKKIVGLVTLDDILEELFGELGGGK